ncbi:FkbM family methyltransferase [uncultured Phenylobacterium sp.]|uniref:FkbM family methyltransferase n=1 Tax=uncultured Phenylobacterium sp. TaxID=349273 RepID=UPI0025FC3453|nr:FkbM family methyltransferase [uncultured Phenylobacterium sp.]
MDMADLLTLLVGLRDRTAWRTDHPEFPFIHFCLEHLTRSKSQLLQELWVLYELGSPTGGYFVEIGACDGVSFSNTYLLEKQFAWTGIVVEPSRVWYPKLRENRACAVDERCVWGETGASVLFNEASVAMHATIDSYSDGDMHAESRRVGRRYAVETVSLNDLLRTWGAPGRIDYLSLDTEGSELDILSAFDFDAHDVRLITVEHNYTDRRQAIFDLLTAKGFARKFESLSRVDDWYVAAR